MRKILLIITAIALVGCGKKNQPAPLKELKESESTGLIADPINEKAIREALGKPKGKLTKADLKKVEGFGSRGLNNVKIGEEEKLDRLMELHRTTSAHISDTNFEDLIKLTKITYLGLRGSKITDKGLKDLANLRKLRLLGLERCKGITEAGVAELKKALPDCWIVLKRGNIEAAVPMIEGEPMPTVEPKPAIKIITDPIVEKAIRRSFRPSINELAAWWEGVRKLDFTRSKITDAGLKDVAKCKNLEDLRLGATEITDTGLMDVAKLEKHSDLMLQNTKITDAGLKEVAKLKELRTLVIFNTKITDAGIKELANCRKLDALYLDDTKITDAGLEELAKMKGLGLLFLRGTKATKAGVVELQKALPECSIIHDAKE